MVPVTVRIEEQQLKLLNKISKEVHIPRAVLIRRGIDLILRQMKEGLVVHSEIEALLTEDRSALRRLAE